MPQLDLQLIGSDKKDSELDLQPLDVSVTQKGPETGSVVEQPSLLSRAWHTISDPLTDAPSRFAKSISDYITDPNQALFGMHETGEGGFHDYAANTLAKLRGFEGGALEGIGNLASGLTSPLSLGTIGLGGAEYTAGKTGLESVAQAANFANKGIGGLTAAHGVGNVISPDSTLAERGHGLVEMALGGAGMLHSPVTSEIPPVEPTESQFTTSPPKTEGNVKFTTKSEADIATATAADKGIHDPYAKWREVPLGTKYKISPGDISRDKIIDAVKLGFDYEGLGDDGKIVLTKTKPSPLVKDIKQIPMDDSKLAQVANLPRTLMASVDMSAPLRQGLGLIHKKAFWTALPDMVKAWGSEDAYRGIMDSITEKPMFKKTVAPDGKVLPSFAEQSGLKLTDLNNMSTREESIMSKMAEKIPGVRPSERAYTAFLNKLRADTFEQMLTDFKAYSGIDAKNNLALGKDVANFVNTASGRGSLGPLEDSGKALSSVLFSPRLIASRLGMMAKGGTALFSPETYMLSQPSIRREYLKSLMAVAAVANTFTQLGRLAGGTVESDPASSDLGKLKLGNSRIDPYGGFQQYIVLAQRLLPEIDLSSTGLQGKFGGQMKSTVTGREYSLSDTGFGRSTRADVLSRFIRSKTNPIINFAWGMMSGMKEVGGKPMKLTETNLFENAIAQRFIPMVMQDVYEMANDETTSPSEKALATFLGSVGMGVQTYGGNPVGR